MIPTTMRERMLAVIRRQEHDRVPFVQYSGTGAPNEEAWSVLGRDQMGVLRWSAVHRFAHPNCRYTHEEFERAGRRVRRNTLHTPAGSLTEERIFETGYGSSAIREHYVKDPADYPVLAAYLRDLVVLEDFDHFRRDWDALGDDGLPLAAVARTPYQQMWVQWVSVQDLCLHRVDYPEAVEECFAALEQVEMAIFEVVRKAAAVLPLPMIDVPDNITAPVIGEANFRRFCLPLYRRLDEMLSEWDIPVFVHMDGDLKPLWGAIGESRVRGLDSLSPPPDNDTSAGDAVRLWPEMRVCPNFPSSVHLAQPEGVYAQAARMLEEAGHSGRFWIQISENVPRDAWRTSYPQIVRAINDFGRP